jgi:hypothetical protein
MLCEDDEVESGRFRFRLRTHFAWIALATFACLVILMLAPIFDVPGVFADLPAAEQRVLETLRADGIPVLESRASLPDSFDLRCKVMVRRAGDGSEYHVTAVQLHGFSDGAGELLAKRLRELPELNAISLLPGWGGGNLRDMLRKELHGCRVEYLTNYDDW